MKLGNKDVYTSLIFSLLLLVYFRWHERSEKLNVLLDNLMVILTDNMHADRVKVTTNNITVRLRLLQLMSIVTLVF